jgi:carboxypeptidase Q
MLLRNTLLMCSLTATVAMGQSSADSSVLQKIRHVASLNSSVPGSMTMLSDVIGPRLLGTAAYNRAATWSKNKLKSFGADTAFFESFGSQYRGWRVRSFNIEMTTPSYMHLIAYPLAYTQSTRGTIEAAVVYVAERDQLKTLKGKLKGKIVLLGDTYTPFHTSPQILSETLTKDILTQARDNPDPNDRLIGYHSRRSTQQAITAQEARRLKQKVFFDFCALEGVAALIEPSDYPYGILHADGNGNIPAYNKVNDTRPIPSFVIANEHFGRLVRLLKSGITPKLKVNLQTTFNYNPEFNVNVIADIKGADDKLSKQQVIIGAHLDSWHGGTGASDNAAGCAVMLEAIRVLQTSGLQMKRSIRIVLWGGEEQSFAGSKAYVDQNVGSLASGDPRKDFSNISAYFNLDNGTGKIRGLYTQGNTAAKKIFEEYLRPFGGTVTLQNVNQTDHELFDALNIPAFQFIQDPLNYISAVHHTTMDVADHVDQNNLKENAVIVAWLIYKVAMQDDLLPRRDFISVKPSLQGNTTFFLSGFETAKSVSLVGNFNNWNMFGTPLEKTPDGWICKLDLQKGKFLYKYIVDGDWTADPKTPADKLLKDGKGHAGLTKIVVE